MQCLILCTAPAVGDEAERLARGLVEAHLAACVNIIPGLQSFYTWKGQLESDPEVQLLIKTVRSRFDDVKKWLGDNHPYEVPEILMLPIEAAEKKYAEWMDEQTR